MNRITPVLFPAGQLANRWNVSVWTIRKLMKSGALASLQVGGRRLVTLDAVVNAELNGGIGGRKPRSGPGGSSLAGAAQAESERA
jgi:hypothetical protein